MFGKFSIHTKYSRIHEPLGWITIYDEEHATIEVNPNGDIKRMPFLMQKTFEIGELTLNNELSMTFIDSRVVPEYRQGLEYELKKKGLYPYNKLKIFEYFKGRCSRDNFYIKRIE